MRRKRAPTQTKQILLFLIIVSSRWFRLVLVWSVWDSEVVGRVVRYVTWLNQYVFVYVLVGMLCAQSIEQTPSDDASILNLCTLSHDMLPLLRDRREPDVSLSHRCPEVRCHVLCR